MLMQKISFAKKEEAIGVSYLDLLCRDEGWNLPELSELLGFDTQYHRQGKGVFRYKFPPHIGFILLRAEHCFKLAEHCFKFNDKDLPVYADNFYAIGLRRTDNDTSTGRVEPYWNLSTRHSNTIQDVTAFAFMHYSPFNKFDNEFDVSCIQSTVIKENDRKRVLAEMQEMKGVAGVEKRTQNLLEYGVPWAYSDRTLLFGPAAIWFANCVGAESANFNYFSDDRPGLLSRTYRFALEHMRQKPIQIELKEFQ
jgi:hypothetical protein